MPCAPTDHNAWNLPQTLVDANNIRTTLVYDGRGRLKDSTRHSRDGERTTHFELDAEGLITEVTLPNGVTLFYDYDAADRLEFLRDADGNKLHYVYDSHGNVEMVERFDGSDALLQKEQKVKETLTGIRT